MFNIGDILLCRNPYIFSNDGVIFLKKFKKGKIYKVKEYQGRGNSVEWNSILDEDNCYRIANHELIKPLFIKIEHKSANILFGENK